MAEKARNQPPMPLSAPKALSWPAYRTAVLDYLAKKNASIAASEAKNATEHDLGKAQTALTTAEESLRREIESGEIG